MNRSLEVRAVIVILENHFYLVGIHGQVLLSYDRALCDYIFFKSPKHLLAVKYKNTKQNKRKQTKCYANFIYYYLTFTEASQ